MDGGRINERVKRFRDINKVVAIGDVGAPVEVGKGAKLRPRGDVWQPSECPNVGGPGVAEGRY